MHGLCSIELFSECAVRRARHVGRFRRPIRRRGRSERRWQHLVVPDGSKSWQVPMGWVTIKFQRFRERMTARQLNVAEASCPDDLAPGSQLEIDAFELPG